LSEDSFALLSLESLVVIKQGFQAFCEELHTAMENLHSAPFRTARDAVTHFELKNALRALMSTTWVARFGAIGTVDNFNTRSFLGCVAFASAPTSTSVAGLVQPIVPESSNATDNDDRFVLWISSLSLSLLRRIGHAVLGLA
jgi:hypothetical protein